MSTTESASPRFADIEYWSAADLVDGMVEGQFASIAAVRAASPAIARGIDAAVERLSRGGRLIYVGAGTSGRIAAQDAAELPPTFSWPYERAISVMAGGERALLRAAEGAEDNRDMARQALAALEVAENDVVVALAASGRTPFAIAALDHARETGALAIGIFNNPDSKLGAACDIPILLDTGPEFIAGSTRMKAGTAQKAALNCLSTGIMIRLGFVFRGKMVEMRPTNDKLQQRAVTMVAELADCDAEAAASALAAAGGSIKLAVLMLLRSLPPRQAEALLDRHGGNLARALR
ncbi:MAG: N-acetylmuramic acid 6-phosphate etherase [Devosia sp.]|nr:N-acetylmuramic acid 6-phosphate etherase [Devosia sp.]